MLRYLLLGSLLVTRDGVPLELGSPKQRTVLAVLLLERGRVVSTDRLADVVWGDDPPPNATSSLHAYISNLRRILGGGAAERVIVREAPGYRLQPPPGSLDLDDFLALAEDARKAEEVARSAPRTTPDDGGLLRAAGDALALWRGPLLAELSDASWVRLEAAALEERRTACRELLITGLLDAGRVPEALAEATALSAEDPLRENGCWFRALATYRAGRSPEALTVIREHTERLDEELGLEPGSRIRTLQSAVLRQEPWLSSWPRPVPAPRVPAAVAEAGPAPSGPPAAVPEPRRSPDGLLVGRRRELAVLEQALDDARSGSPRWVVLTGPAGIGKTRLAQEAAARTIASGGSTAWTTVTAERGAPAWWSWRPVLRALGADPDEVLDPGAVVDPDVASFAVFEKVVGVVERAAAEAPRLLVFDDAQWADPLSVRCLVHLAGALRTQRVAVALTLREGEDWAAVRPLLDALARVDGRRDVAVPPLGPAAVSDLLTAVSGSVADAAEAQALADRTGGNPLFVREYAQLPAADRLGDRVPLAVRSILERRLAGLAPDVLKVLRAAAVLGDPTDVELLGMVTGLDLESLADCLDAAVDQQVLMPDPNGARFTFAHGLLRDEVLRGVTGLRRQRLHLRAAEAVGSRASRNRSVRRAQHLVAALPLADTGEALEACRVAAREAERNWDAEGAATWWEAALATFDRLPEGTASPDERDDLQVARVAALTRAGRGQTVLDVLDEGLLEAVRAGRTATAGRLAGMLLRVTGAWPWVAYGEDPSPLRSRLAGLEPFVADDAVAHVRVLAALAVGSYYEPDAAVPDALSRRALDLAEASGDADAVADALLARVLTYAAQSAHAEESVAHLQRLLDLPHTLSRLDEVLAHNAMTNALLCLGDLTGVAEHLQRGLAGSDLLRLPVARVQLRWMEASLAQWQGRFAEADALARAVEPLHRRTELYTGGVLAISRFGRYFEAGRLAELDLPAPGRPDDPDSWGLEAVAAARGLRDEAAGRVATRLAATWTPRWTDLGHLTLLAHVVADLELVEHAERLESMLEPDAGRVASVGQITVLGPVDLGRARLLALLGRGDEARAALAAATALAERERGRPSLVRSRLLAAQLQDPGRARGASLDAVAAEAEQLGMAGVARAAREDSPRWLA